MIAVQAPTHTQTGRQVLAVVHELGGAVDEASPAHAQRGLPVQPAGLVDDGGQRQTQVGHAGVLPSVLSKGVAQALRAGQSERIKS